MIEKRYTDSENISTSYGWCKVVKNEDFNKLYLMALELSEEAKQDIFSCTNYEFTELTPVFVATKYSEQLEEEIIREFGLENEEYEFINELAINN